MGGGHHLSFSRQLTVSNGFLLMVWICAEITLCSGSFKWGGRTSPVIFSSSDCFEWVLIDGMDMHRVHLFSLAVSFGGRTLAKVGLSARFELISSFALASQSSFVSYKK